MARYKVCWDEVVVSTGLVRSDTIEFEYEGPGKKAAFEKMYWDSLQKQTNAIFGFDVYSVTRGGAPIYEGKGVMWDKAKLDIWLDTLSAKELKQFIKYQDKRLKEDGQTIHEWLGISLGYMMRLTAIRGLARDLSLMRVLEFRDRKATIDKLADICKEISPSEAYNLGQSKKRILFRG